MNAQKTIICLFCILATTVFVFADDIRCLSLPPAKGMERADLYYLKPSDKKVRAALVLCPGSNGNGESYLRDKRWIDYANRNQLVLVGLSFASGGKEPKYDDFYYYASRGSGQLLLDGLKKIYGFEIPILMYGFSGGAHFTSRFVEWKPERIVAWCAYSAGWWDKPLSNKIMPPGIVACGTEDERLKSCLDYFWDGRELGKPWLLLELEGIGHRVPEGVDDFVREYFDAILNHDASLEKDGIWVDIYTGKILSDRNAAIRPCAAGWIPDRAFYGKWLFLNGKGKKE